MALTIDQIQARFPNPRKIGSTPIVVDNAFTYCVGGALCLSTDRAWYWPDRPQLALALRDLNPTLSRKQAFWYATRIIGANDREDFARAWQLARQALQRRGDAITDEVSNT